jgi:phosphotransferase system HPr-like phosphotransfer protein
MRKAAAMVVALVVIAGPARAGENQPSPGWCDARGKQWQRYEFVELADKFYCEITRVPEDGQSMELRSTCSGRGQFKAVSLTLQRTGDTLTISSSGDDPEAFGSGLGVRTFQACGPD